METYKNLYSQLEALNKDIQHSSAHLEQLKLKRDEIQTKYRIASVCRVLDYIHSESCKGRNFKANEISTMMVHCQNKLYGNIDGVELPLSQHEYTKEDDL